MKRCLAVAIPLLAGTLQCLGGDPFHVPTRGEWQGQAIGSWKAVRRISRSQTKPTKKSGIFKTLLLGEDEGRNTILVHGEADEHGRYLGENRGESSTAWSEDDPIPIPAATRDEVLMIDGQAYPVVVKAFGPKPDRRLGVLMASTAWELKSRPGFLLKRNRSWRDNFRGETYERLITEQVVGVGRTDVLGKNVRSFRIRQVTTVNGRTTSQTELLKSDELPEQGVIHRLRTWYGHGRERGSAETKLVAFGHAPEEAALYRTRKLWQDFSRARVVMDSETGRAHVVHLMRQGMPEAVAQEVVSARSGTIDLGDGKESAQARRITTEWNAHQADPSAETRASLLRNLQHPGFNSVGYIEPGLEKVLLEISQANDPELRIVALAGLTGYVPVLYAPILEDTLIREKQCTNPPALRALSSAKWGNARRVLSQDGVDLGSLPLRLLPHAPEPLAIRELLRRFAAGSKRSKSEITGLLGYYSTPEVRSLFSQLSDELTADDFVWGKTDRSYLVLQVITAAANLDLENAPELFLKWMAWNDAVDPARSAKRQGFAMLVKSAVDMELMIGGARLRNPRVNSRISERITREAIPPSLFLADEGLGFLSDEGLDKLGDIKLDITPEKMAALLSKPVPAAWSEEPLTGEKLYGLLRLFRFSPHDGYLTYIMSKLAPGWTAETDYAAIAMVESKHWYVHRKRIRPLDVRAMRLGILADILPYFGDRGAQILIQLCAHPGLRLEMAPALMAISHRRDEARDLLSQVHARDKEDKFLLDLALWCLGDASRRAECEKYMRFEPLHQARSHQVWRALRYLPFGTVYPLLQDMRNGNPDNGFGMRASVTLSYHRNRQSAEFIMSLWEKAITSQWNPIYGELFNRMAGRNFGCDRDRIREWIQTLPEE
jgi:hypothetical protein